MLFAALMVFHFAQPEFETLFDRFYALELRTRWDRAVLRYFAYTILLGLGVSLGGMMLGLFRARRKTDSRRPIMVLGFLYLVLIIVYGWTIYL